MSIRFTEASIIEATSLKAISAFNEAVYSLGWVRDTTAMDAIDAALLKAASIEDFKLSFEFESELASSVHHRIAENGRLFDEYGEDMAPDAE